MTDTATERSEAVEELTTKLREVEHLMVELGRDTVDALVDAARARVDTLRVRLDLGRMEARDELAAPLDEAEHTIGQVRERFESLSHESADVGTALAEGVRSARADLQAAVEMAQERIEADAGS